jgi:hypothetical protein
VSDRVKLMVAGDHDPPRPVRWDFSTAWPSTTLCVGCCKALGDFLATSPMHVCADLGQAANGGAG